MKQITNLQETIYNDKLAVEKLEKQLHFAKGILKTHEQALERLLSPVEYLPVEKEKSSPQSIEKQETPKETTIVEKERITLENWKDLGIGVGDEVEIVVSGDKGCRKGVYEVEDMEYSDYEGDLFLDLGHKWYEYNRDGEFKDELYLIRTEKGSLKNG